MVDGSDFIAAARRYLGVKFQHQGRSLRGVDCLGLVALAAKDCGIQVNDRTDYHYNLKDGCLLAGVLEHCTPIATAVPGCLAVFGFKTGQQHVAIVTAVDPVYILHAYYSGSKVVEHRLPGLDEHDIFLNEQVLIGYYEWKQAR